jgi:hypothetical protein
MPDRTRAQIIIDVANATNAFCSCCLVVELHEILDEVQGTDRQDLFLIDDDHVRVVALAMRDAFAGDDDCDDLRHELMHELDECNDHDLNCPWHDEDDED